MNITEKIEKYLSEAKMSSVPDETAAVLADHGYKHADSNFVNPGTVSGAKTMHRFVKDGVSHLKVYLNKNSKVTGWSHLTKLGKEKASGENHITLANHLKNE